jgi:hypothetical protein
MLLAILCLIGGTACTESTPNKLVSRGDYNDQSSCWFNEGGEFNAFVILNSEGLSYRPVYVSKYCRIDNGLSGPNYIFNLPKFWVSGDSGLAMRKGLINRPILSTLTDHGAYFTDEFKIFEITAVLVPSGRGHWNISEVIGLRKRTDLSLDNAESW